MPAQVRHDGRAISYRFDRFTLDPTDRRLFAGSAPVELNARYFDALVLLVRDAGSLVTKDRFMAEVWAGIPVTDEALTQCIRTLRRLLGDDAAGPRFIETVPKHGYRFIAPVTAGASPPPTDERPGLNPATLILRTAVAGTLGGTAAGLVGGLVYGSFGAADPGIGALSVLLVLTGATLLIAIVGAAGVSLGLAAAQGHHPAWAIAGGAGGGLAVGALVSLLARDAFALLVGQSPGWITGAPEGAALGAAAGLALWVARRGTPSLRRAALAGIGLGGSTGVAIAALGGKLMAGSLVVLAESFPESRLRIDALGGLLGEAGIGPATSIVTAGLEGALFTAGLVIAIVLADKLAMGHDAEPLHFPRG